MTSSISAGALGPCDITEADALAAARTIARNATDPAEARELLQACGLIPTPRSPRRNTYGQAVNP